MSRTCPLGRDQTALLIEAQGRRCNPAAPRDVADGQHGIHDETSKHDSCLTSSSLELVASDLRKKERQPCRGKRLMISGNSGWRSRAGRPAWDWHWFGC